MQNPQNLLVIIYMSLRQNQPKAKEVKLMMSEIKKAVSPLEREKPKTAKEIAKKIEGARKIERNPHRDIDCLVAANYMKRFERPFPMDSKNLDALRIKFAENKKAKQAELARFM